MKPIKVAMAYISWVLVFLVIFDNDCNAQLLSYSNATNGLISYNAPNTIVTNLMRVNATTAATLPCPSGFSSSGFSNISTYNTAVGAIETTIKPNAGYVLNVTGFTALLRRNAAGPSKVRFAYSTDGVNWISQNINQTIPNMVCDSGIVTSWVVGTTVIAPATLKFRIYGFNASKTAGVLQILNLMINGSVSAINCTIPVNLTVNEVTSSSAKINWNGVAGALNYKVNYRKSGTANWSSASAVSNEIILNGLSPLTTYQVKIKTSCSPTNTSNFTPSLKFTTSHPIPLPAPDHIVILILENHKYSSIIGSPYAPFINALATDTNGALFTQSYAITHPSQPNYICLFSGSNQGVVNNTIPIDAPFTTANLARSLQDASLTFITYSEDLPSIGFNGEYSGAYARKHNPVANWMGTGINQVDSTVNQPFTAFPQANFNLLPTVCYVIPNQDNDMHNGNDPTPIIIGDNWINTNLNSYIQWAKTHNSLFILTFDEDNGTENNRVATLFLGPMVQAGQYANYINHFNVLRTLEDMYGLPYAGDASSPIDYCWKTVAPKNFHTTSFLNENKISVTPNPVSDELNIKADFLNDKNKVEIYITNLIGKEIFSQHFTTPISEFKIETTGFPSGIYFLKIKTDNEQQSFKFIKE